MAKTVENKELREKCLSLFSSKNIFYNCGPELINEYKTVEDLYNNIVEKRLFLEEIVIQNEEWGRICPKSVNTIRAMTRIINGKAELFYAAARIGNGKVIMDNFHHYLLLFELL